MGALWTMTEDHRDHRTIGTTKAIGIMILGHRYHRGYKDHKEDRDHRGHMDHRNHRDHN